MQTTNLIRYLPFLIVVFLALTFTLPSINAKTEEKYVGDLAPDFDIVNIYSNISSKLSDYQGKVIILDLFATWCGPCVVALPQIIRIQNSYNSSDLQIISIDVDSSESYSKIMKFALDNGMDWIVTLDGANMNQNYGTDYIPTMYIINQTGYVVYQEIGFNYQGVINALDELIAADNNVPVIENLQINPMTTPLTFSQNTVTIEADNIIDNFGIYEIFVQIDNGNSINNIMISRGISGSLSITFAIPPSLLFNTSQIAMKLGATDYRGNLVLSTEVEMSVELVDVDITPPVISDVTVTYTSNSTHYFFTATVTVLDDVFVDGITMLLKEGNQPQGYTIKEIIRDPSDLSLFGGFLTIKQIYINNPDNVGVVITATDISGKETKFTPSTSEINVTPVFSISIVLLSFFSILIIKKKR